MGKLHTCYRCGEQPCVCRDGITLYHGDCRDILPLLDPGSVDLVCTDPPYGINYKNATWPDNPTDYATLMRSLVSQWNRVCGGWVFVFQAMPNVPRFHWWFPTEYRIFAALKNFSQVTPTRIRHSWDPVVFWCNGDKGKPQKGIVNRDFHIGDTASVVSGAKCKHPCPRPLDTICYIIGIASLEGAMVLDAFAGTGTTGRACKDLGRKCIMVEIEEKYCEIAARRLEQEVLFR